MTSATVIEVRRLPVEFDRLVIVLTAQAHLYNALFLITRPDIYRSLLAALALWTVSFGVPIGCLIAARRTGGLLSGRAFVIASAVLLIGVDLGLTLLTRPAELGSPAVWQWACVGVSILTLSPFRPPRDILTLAGLHAAAAAVTLVVAAGQPTVSGYRAVQDISSALLPAFAAAQYVQLYGRALRLRDRAVAQELNARTQAETAKVVQEDSRRRLGALRSSAVRLLAAVRDGADPQADAVTAEAQRLSDAVRSELVEARSGVWLLERPLSIAADHGRKPVDSADDGWPGLILLDPEHMLERLVGDDRASLAGVISALRGVGTWHRVSVVLVGIDSKRATVAVVAGGPAAGRALNSAVVGACAHGWGAVITGEGPALITVERDVDLLAAANDSTGRLSREAAALMSDRPSTFGTASR